VMDTIDRLELMARRNPSKKAHLTIRSLEDSRVAAAIYLHGFSPSDPKSVEFSWPILLGSSRFGA
jgi:hypothetical protein